MTTLNTIKYLSLKDIEHTYYFNYYSVRPIYNHYNKNVNCCPKCQQNIFAISLFYKKSRFVYCNPFFEVELYCYFCKWSRTFDLNQDQPYFYKVKQLHV